MGGSPHRSCVAHLLHDDVDGGARVELCDDDPLEHVLEAFGVGALARVWETRLDQTNDRKQYQDGKSEDEIRMQVSSRAARGDRRGGNREGGYDRSVLHIGGVESGARRKGERALTAGGGGYIAKERASEREGEEPDTERVYSRARSTRQSRQRSRQRSAVQ